MNLRVRRLPVVLVGIALAFPLARPLAGCHPGAPEPSAQPLAAPSTPPATTPPAAHAGRSLVWIDPPGWRTVHPSSAMRRAQYAVPRAPGDSDDGELVVFHFGGGQGGSVEDNLTRWYSQFEQPDGGSTRSAPRSNSNARRAASM